MQRETYAFIRGWIVFSLLCHKHNQTLSGGEVSNKAVDEFWPAVGDWDAEITMFLHRVGHSLLSEADLPLLGLCLVSMQAAQVQKCFIPLLTLQQPDMHIWCLEQLRKNCCSAAAVTAQISVVTRCNWQPPQQFKRLKPKVWNCYVVTGAFKLSCCCTFFIWKRIR